MSIRGSGSSRSRTLPGPIARIASRRIRRPVFAPILAAALLTGACASTGPDRAEPVGTPPTDHLEPTGGTVDAGDDLRTDDSSGSDDGSGSDDDSGSKDGAAADGSGGTGFAVELARWEGCGDGLECATVAVPVDHDDPTGATIDLAMARVPADDRDGSGVIGSILVNPGGPGASGIETLRNGFRLDDETMDDDHLVGFDPRGVGDSAPLACEPGTPSEPLPDLAPDDPTERAELDRAARELAERCQELDGDLLPYLSTDSVVADLDLLRQAIGDDELRYLGLSYGTVIGLRYAERFPERVGRMVLDGVVDPSRPLAGLLAQQAEGFERVLGAADETCGSGLSCPPDGIVATYDRLASRLDSGGAIDGIGPSELAIGTLVGLYAESLWPRLAQALHDADRGDLSGIRSLYLLYEGAADNATYHAVLCSDGPVPTGPEGWDRLEADLAAHSARFGPVLANELRACAHWPVRSSSAPGPVAPKGIAPILVLSTTGDAATPIENAVAVTEALPGAGLVTVDDTSHTAYGRNFCVERIVADYLATGQVPSSPHRC